MTDTTLSLDQIVSGGQLPALPQSAIRILELAKDSNNGPAEFTVPIESDPGLTGQVLRFVNSSYFGFSREISSVKLAITLVGIRTIKNFTLWSAVFSLMPNPKCGPFDLKSLWQDSLRRALFARLAGQFQGIKDADDLFAAALLQDMAVPLLAKELPKEYVDLLEDRDGGRQRLSTLEQNKFGWDHAEAAAMMARAWDLPEELAGPIETHTEIESLIASGKATPHALAVALSSLLPPSVDEQWVEWGRFQTAYQAVCPKGGPAIAEVLRQVDEGFVEFAPVLQMSTPARTLVDALQQAQ